MLRALTLAERGWGRVHPNPMVGAVVARGGDIVGEGWHAEFGDRHAEPAALAAAGAAARGATLYVTLEPCAHHGKQPPCTDAIIASGVARVVYAMEDPDPAARGGAAQLAAAGIEVSGGTCDAEARRLNARFVRRHEGGTPFVSVKLAATVDGLIADADAASRWISGASARAWTHRLRANQDGIAVGAATALADSARLTVRGDVTPRVPPRRIVFDRSGRLGDDWSMPGDGDPPPIVVSAPSIEPARRRMLESRGVQVVAATDLGDALTQLGALGVDALLVEGGGRLAGAMLDAGLVHRVYQVQCPVWLGDGIRAWTMSPRAISDALRWRTVERVALGDDTVLVMEP